MIPKKMYLDMNTLSEMSKAAEVFEPGDDKFEYVCLRAAWREAEKEKPEDGKAAIFMVAHEDDGKTFIDGIYVGEYEAPSEELDEYGDDGEGWSADDGCKYPCCEVIGWAYLSDIVPNYKDEIDA